MADETTSSTDDPTTDEAPEALDQGQFNAQLLEFDRDVVEAEKMLASAKKDRADFYAEWQPKVAKPLTLHELLQIQKKITKTEDTRRIRVLENMERLGQTMNVGPRPKRDPMVPIQKEQE